jgi:hypothetical protein
MLSIHSTHSITSLELPNQTIPNTQTAEHKGEVDHLWGAWKLPNSGINMKNQYKNYLV